MNRQKKRKNRCHFLPVCCFPLLIGVMWFAAQAAEAEVCRFIINSRNERIEVCGQIRRIAALPTDALEVIRILNLTDRVVGCNTNVAARGSFWPKLKNLPQIGHPFEPNYEQLVFLKPDVVIAYGGLRPGPELEVKLVPLGITVLRMDFFRMSAIVKEVSAFGALTGRQNEAARYAAWYEKWRSFLNKRLKTAHRPPPKVYLEGYADFKASGPESEGFAMGVAAGGSLITAHKKIPNPLVTNEVVVDWNPDVIGKMVSGQTPYEENSPKSLIDVRKKMMARPGWSYISAVKTGRVYAISADIGPGPRGIIGILYMAKIFYPDVFRDLDVRDVHREYMEQFQNVSYKGVYVYPDV